MRHGKPMNPLISRLIGPRPGKSFATPMLSIHAAHPCPAHQVPPQAVSDAAESHWLGRYSPAAVRTACARYRRRSSHATARAPPNQTCARPRTTASVLKGEISPSASMPSIDTSERNPRTLAHCRPGCRWSALPLPGALRIRRLSVSDERAAHTAIYPDSRTQPASNVGPLHSYHMGAQL
ncbi:hypothetical protein BU23DRAFT_567240 [Bimuria novae-zelandiae CBS 107.79]|uniref:Uncharacterized protein n=1 Tax=Bimuria novae-zelandiae CBS 107.79 TaxID=1447943 RepID=A0A6A5VDH5_9PLEO|nr:hypothetical protein BU23DRAFT_567240 [Bimuria novae-zelandiae CBS 107.79]